jgi:hypothetical protein
MPVDMKSWAEQLREEGALRARREVVALLLHERFGSAPDELEEQLADLDTAALDALLVRIIHVASVEEIMAGVGEARDRRGSVQERSSPRSVRWQSKAEIDAETAAWLLQRTVDHIEQDTQHGKLLVEASRRQEKREELIRAVEERFGAVPADLSARLAYRDQPTIESLAEHLGEVATLEQFMARVPAKVLSTKDGGITMGELEQRWAEDTIASYVGNVAVEEAVARYRRAREVEGRGAS